MCVCRSAYFNLFNRHVLVRAAAALAGWTGIREVGDSASDVVKKIVKKMNFCQINVSEYFVIANDAWCTIKIEKKRREKSRTKLDPNVRRERARLYKIFARKRLFGDLAFVHTRATFFPHCIFFSRGVSYAIQHNSPTMSTSVPYLSIVYARWLLDSPHLESSRGDRINARFLYKIG